MSHITCAKLEEFINSIRLHSELSLLLVADNGKPLKAVNFDAKKFPHDEIEYIAKLVKLRFSIVDFNKIFGGLEMTVNVFRHYNLFVFSLNTGCLAAIISENKDVERMRQLINEIRSVCHV